MHLKHRLAEPIFATLISPDVEENQYDPRCLACGRDRRLGIVRRASRLSLSTRPTSPLQQQIQQDYRSNLLSAQHELSQSNPSGLSRQQITIGHQLNDYNSMPR
jgi:hypothetical protein